MNRTNHPISRASFHKVAIHRDKVRVFILALLVLASMSCAGGELIEPFLAHNNTPAFIPFTPEDCNLGGFLAPDTATRQIYPTNIYCPYLLNRNLQGTLFLTLQYVEDPAKSDYADMQKAWNDTFQSWMKMNGAESHGLINTPLTQSVMVVVKGTEPGAQDMTADLLDLILYKDHFIIYISGGVTVTSESDASALDLELIKHAEETADSHYK